MGVMNEPPPVWQEAQAHDEMVRSLPPVILAHVRIISQNIKLRGTNSQQQAFKMTVAEIRGIIARAQAQIENRGEALKKAHAQVIQAITVMILDNPAYDEFKVTTAEGPDSFKIE